MEFGVYPKSGRMTVAPGATSDAVVFEPLAGKDPLAGLRLTVFIAVTTLIPGSDEARRAEVALSATAGDEQTPQAPFASVGTISVPLKDQEQRIVARANITTEGAISAVRVRPSDPPLPPLVWRLKVTNKDVVERDFTFVVSDGADGTKQGWIDVGDPEGFDVIAGQPAQLHEFWIANRGTGTLELFDKGNVDLGAGFHLEPGAETVDAYSTVTRKISFKPEPVAGRSALAFAFASDDPRAGLERGHNRLTRVTATVRAPLWSSNDILVVDSQATDGSTARGGGLIKIDPETGFQSMITAGRLIVNPVALAIERNGNVVIAYSGRVGGQGGVMRVDRLTGAQVGLASGGLVANPSAVAVRDDGTILVADRNSAALVKVKPTGDPPEIFVQGGSLQRPLGVAVEHDGNVVVLDGTNPAVVIRVSTTGGQSPVAGAALSPTPNGIAVARNGQLLFATANPVAVTRFDPEDGSKEQLSTGAKLRRPARLVSFGDDVLVTDSQVPGVIRLTAAAEVEASTGGLLRSPFGVVVVPEGL